jgi:DUF4097 and DUF4098 domain-containing protein YvlB
MRRAEFAFDPLFRHAEVRESVGAIESVIVIDAGPNGAVQIDGQDRPDVKVTSTITADARSEAEATRIVAAVQVSTTDGRIVATGPDIVDGSWWSVGLSVSVPRAADLDVSARNGDITLRELEGDVECRAANGGLLMQHCGGTITGETTNGAIEVELVGSTWRGQGMSLKTRNGNISIVVPQTGYAAVIDLSTAHGRVQVELPYAYRTDGPIRRMGTRTRVQLGEGGPHLRVRTHNGAVIVSAQKRRE